MIRLFKMSNFYPEALAEFYRREPERAEMPYGRQYRELMDQAYHWADFWKIHLEATSRFLVEDVVANAEPLQEQWVSEHAVDIYDAEERATEILIAQIREFAPDVFFAHAFPMSRPDLIERVRREVPSIRLIIGWDGTALNDAAKFPGRDVMLTCVEFVAEAYRAQGVPAYCVPFSFDASLLHRLPERREALPPTFVGSLHYGAAGHNQRARLLSLLARETDIALYVSFPKMSPLLKARCMLGYAKRGQFGQARDMLRMSGRSIGARHGLDMFRTLRDSPFTVNTHIDAAATFAGNVRLFEATGVGTCLLTDWKQNLADFFEPDVEVATYRSPEECLEKYRWLQDHPKECAEIARRGQERTLREHTYTQRMQSVATIVERHLS